MLSENHNDKIALVAIYDNTIIGYFSINFTENPDEVYGRCLVIDQDFQGQKIMYKLLEHCYKLIPTIKRMVCVTRNINLGAQKLYEYFGGEKVDNPSWLRFLPTYPAINTTEWVGYSFDEKAIQACCHRFGNLSIL